MRILLIGGGGLLGTGTSRHLAGRHEVRVLDRYRATAAVPEPTDGPPVDLEFVEGDCTDQVTVRQAVSGVDAVVHMAAVVPRIVGADDPERVAAAFAVNVASVHLALTEAARADCQAFVHVSSLSVFQRYLAEPVDAQAAPDAVHPYGLTKRLAEQVCATLSAELPLAVVSLRLAHPTPDADWPLWRLPEPGTTPREVTMADGTVLPALSAEDAARAFEAAIGYRGPYRALGLTGGQEGVALLNSDTQQVLDWVPTRHI